MEINAEIDQKNKKLNKLLRIGIYLLMFFFSISLTMISPMMPVIVKQFSLKLSQGGLIMTYQSIGGVLVTLLMVFIADKYKKSSIIIIGYFIYVISLFAISMAPFFRLILVLFFMFGVGTKIIDNLNNSYLAEKFPEKRGVYLNILHGVFGVGALVGPIFARYLMDIGISWELVFLILGLFSLVVLVFFIIVSRKDKKEVAVNKNGENGGNLLTIIKSYKAWILSIIMFLYVGNQSGLTIWLPMYMESYLKSDPFLASLSLSILWVGIIIGRFACSGLTKKYKDFFLIRWGSIIGGGILLGALLLKSPVILIFSLGLVGLFTGAIFPLIIESAAKWFPDNAGTVTSMIYLILNLSMMFFPWFIGLLADNFDFQWAFLFATGIMLAIFFITFLVKEEV
ncbi:MAG: MFS transporter [bacterium]